jgi:TetR/AcrR family tetracycline transcriptional repressor
MSSTASQTTPTKHPRGHLSRQMIATAGLSVARRDGVDKLTMKRLATELAVTPMAIYRHFEDKSDLIDAILDQFVKENDICNHAVPKSDWTKWLFETYSKMYQGLQSMPSVYPYLSSASRFGPEASAVVEQSLLVMQGAGFSLKRAREATNALNGFVIGCAIMDHAFFQNLATEQDAKLNELGQEVMVQKDIEQDIEPGLQSGLNLIISALKTEMGDQLRS